MQTRYATWVWAWVQDIPPAPFPAPGQFPSIYGRFVLCQFATWTFRHMSESLLQYCKNFVARKRNVQGGSETSSKCPKVRNIQAAKRPGARSGKVAKRPVTFPSSHSTFSRLLKWKFENWHWTLFLTLTDPWGRQLIEKWHRPVLLTLTDIPSSLFLKHVNRFTL